MTSLKAYTLLASIALASVCILMVLGGAVSFMGAAKAIPDWPSTFGSILPPAELGAFVEYLHRVMAVIVGLLVVALAVIGLLKFRARPWLLVPPLLTMVLLAVVSTVGALVVLGSVSPIVAAVDVASALMVLALMVTMVQVGLYLLRHPQGTIRLGFRDPFSKLALSATAVLYVVLLSGLSVGIPSPANCLGLPLWNHALSLAGHGSWLRTGHFLLSNVAVVLVFLVAITSWTQSRLQTPRRFLATAAFLLLITSIGASELAAAHGFPWSLMAIRVSTATLLWAALTALVVHEGLQAALPETEKELSAVDSLNLI